MSAAGRVENHHSSLVAPLNDKGPILILLKEKKQAAIYAIYTQYMHVFWMTEVLGTLSGLWSGVIFLESHV